MFITNTLRYAFARGETAMQVIIERRGVRPRCRSSPVKRHKDVRYRPLRSWRDCIGIKTRADDGAAHAAVRADAAAELGHGNEWDGPGHAEHAKHAA